MTPKNDPVLWWPPKISTKSSYPQKYSFSWKHPKIMKFKILSPKNWPEPTYLWKYQSQGGGQPFQHRILQLTRISDLELFSTVELLCKLSIDCFVKSKTRSLETIYWTVKEVEKNTWDIMHVQCLQTQCLCSSGWYLWQTQHFSLEYHCHYQSFCLNQIQV